MSARSFRYLARDEGGTRREGSLEARDRAQAIDRLKAQKLVVTELVEGDATARGLAPTLARLRGPKLSRRRLAMLTRELAALVNSGWQLTRALDVLSEDADDPNLFKVLARIKRGVEGGQPLSSALRQYPGLFPRFYTNLVEAGEHSGDLGLVMDRVAGYLEWLDALQRKAKGAMMYPAVVVLFSLTLVGGLVVVVLPKFSDVYRTLGSQLPWPTATLLALATWLGKHSLLLAALLGAGVVAVGRFLRSEGGQVWSSRVILRLPLVAPLATRLAINHFARTLAMLYQGGIPILTALDLASRSCGNVVFHRALLRCREAVGSGQTLAASLRAAGLFPSVKLSMLDLGERSGTLVEMLNRIAGFYEGEVNATLEAPTSMLEPLLIVWVGVLIAALVLVLFLPIMNLQQLI